MSRTSIAKKLFRPLFRTPSQGPTQTCWYKRLTRTRFSSRADETGSHYDTDIHRSLLTLPCFVVHTPMHNSLISQLHPRPARNVLLWPLACVGVKGERLWTAGWGSIWYTKNIITGWWALWDTYVQVTAWGDLSAAEYWGASYTIPANGEDRLYDGNNTHKHSNKKDQIKYRTHRSNIRAEASSLPHRTRLKSNKYKKKRMQMHSCTHAAGTKQHKLVLCKKPWSVYYIEHLAVICVDRYKITLAPHTAP